MNQVEMITSVWSGSPVRLQTHPDPIKCIASNVITGKMNLLINRGLHLSLPAYLPSLPSCLFTFLSPDLSARFWFIKAKLDIVASVSAVCCLSNQRTTPHPGLGKCLTIWWCPCWWPKTCNRLSTCEMVQSVCSKWPVRVSRIWMYSDYMCGQNCS